jgi:hypothetical protein
VRAGTVNPEYLPPAPSPGSSMGGLVLLSVD